VSTPDDVRAVRAAVNESTFREINEQLSSIAVDGAGLRDVVCECARADCTALVPVTSPEYEAVRADGNHFVVAPGWEHVDTERESVTVSTERYWVVEKLGRAGDVSEELDPRG
jgi:hypothetical protein